ncbi:SLBB domain-containing protein [Spirosoma spitsbergense]|uniref:polysaccharide biosynthesis/export family protein n=1 Tax=Spirosoma spitsbergense TaxID=431554 RepID=UPI00037C076E
MQNSGIKHRLPLLFFYFNTIFSSRLFCAALAVSSMLLGFSAQAQITAPSATPSAPSTSPASPGRGAPTLPAGVNVNNLPPSVQQQIRQATQGNANQRGQTQGANGANGTATDPARTGDDFERQGDTTANGTDQARAKQLFRDAQEREASERRQKLFGYSIFDQAMASSFQPNISMATPRNYIVGPGDELNIRMYGYSEGDFSQKVSPEGFVYIAGQTGIGPISVIGLTVEATKARLTSRMANKFVGLRNSSYGAQNTFLEVSLGNVRSIRVTVTGDALKPGTYTMSSLSTVMNAIYQSGGPSEIGSFRKVQLIRNNKVITTLDLYDYVLTGVQQNDFRLQDNDNIRFTTYIERVEIGGAIKREKIFEMLPKETLDRLLFYAGDFTANAYKNRIKVTRLTDRELKVIDVTVPEFKTFVMQDGDQVEVERLLNRFENKLTIEGAVFRPGEYSLDNNKTLKQLIASAEGLKGDAFTGRINIIRTREDLAIESLSINLADIMTGVQPDIPLQREDQVIVPSRFDLAQQATISVTGEVNSINTEMPFMANMTLDDALVRTGGLKESAAASQVEVIRRRKDVDPSSTTAQLATVFRFDVNRDLTIGNDANKTFTLEPFDQIVVRRSPNYAIQQYAVVVGEVIVPGEYAIISKDQKISDLVVQAGGLSPYAYVEGATLVRPVQLSEDEINRKQRAIEEIASNVAKSVVETEVVTTSTAEPLNIDLKKILANPGSSEDILVQAGDVLRIPKLLETVRIQGEVQLPNTVRYRANQTFQDYISQTGGYTSKSQKRKSFIVYANGSVDRTRKFMFFNIYPHVAPGAEIVVPREARTPLSAQQILTSTVGIAGSLLTLITTLLVISRIK